ncbi:uncharacterized protein TNCT_687721 [Trichonephila clavata]|uniref:Uncharacterized protein n=2 Tax=Nephilidae TaxID=450948 RepID=A0A8X6LV95_TRICU|nr:uncharacterized protein TNCT_687721 [Trichonephila clavata]GFS40171.1 uncharacterized protein NPIL_350651 [Nephila pilipes]
MQEYRLKHPSGCLVVGPSQSGKSFLVRQIISRNAYDYSFKSVKWCYSVFQPWFLEEKKIEFIQGLPETYENGTLLIIDDLMHNLNEKIAELFTVGSHHRNISVILILQNLFPRLNCMRNISLNTMYIILFKNNRDLSQVNCFSRQMYGNKSAFFMDAYKKATSRSFGYLLIDLHPRTPEEYRLRESVFPDSHGFHWIYLPIK